MSSWARGTTATLDATYRTGGSSGTLYDPADPRVDILNPASVVVVNNAVPTQDGVGLYHYDYAVDLAAPLGVWTAHWTGTINGEPEAADDLFTVVEAGSITFPPSSTLAPCELWATAEDVCSPNAELIDPDVLYRMLEVSTTLLRQITKGQFPGVCEHTILPCGQYSADESYVRWVAESRNWGYSTWSYNSRAWGGFCGCNRTVACGCLRLAAIKLSDVHPVVSVSEVILPETGVLDPAEYRIEDRRWLVRLPDADGTNAGWPCCSPEDDPFTVTFTSGRRPPAPLVLAAASLAVELGLLCSAATAGKCRLPVKTTSVSRQGVSMSMQQQVTGMLQEARTGIWEVDVALDAFRGTGRAGVLVPNSKRARTLT